MVARTALGGATVVWRHGQRSSARINPRDPHQKTKEGPSFLTPDLENALRHALRKASDR